MLTPVDFEDRLDNLDRRLDRIEQILPTLATKEDLKPHATKEDLRAYATKETSDWLSRATRPKPI